MSLQRRKKDMTGYYFIFPAFVLLGVVTVFPYVYAIFLSFMKTKYQNIIGFYGLGNYSNVFSSSMFLVVLKNQFLIVVLGGAFQFLLGFSGALALNRSVKGVYSIRSLIMIPWVIPGVVTGLLWQWILDGNYGVLNYLFRIMGVLQTNYPFLSTGWTAMLFLIVVDVWRIFPFVLVMSLSGLQSVPIEQQEAACIDGADTFQRLFHVTIPNMMPIIVLTITLISIWNFKIFDIVWTFTQGGPAGATEVFATVIYKNAFQNANFGYSSAMAVIMGIIIAIPVFLRLKIQSRESL